MVNYLNLPILHHIIAYATSVCHGDDVSKIKYHSQEMRQHFLRCLESGIITQFPSALRASGPPLGKEAIPVYCYCRTLQRGSILNVPIARNGFT